MLKNLKTNSWVLHLQWGRMTHALGLPHKNVRLLKGISFKKSLLKAKGRHMKTEGVNNDSPYLTFRFHLFPQ